MGLILDSSILIAEERRGNDLRHALSNLAARFAGEEVAVSVITVLELAHGVARSNTPQRRLNHQKFLDDLLLAVPVHAVTIPVALRAGQIDGENKAKGIHLAIPDLLIGVTALELDYRVATANLRHFQMIPGLTVLPV
jgi:predicted nucleic acid-binding protein